MKRSDFLKFSGLLGGGLLGGLGLSSCAPPSQGNGTPTGSDWSSVTGSMMDHAAPAIIEETFTTIVVFPGHQLKVNRYGDFVLQCSSNSTAR